MVKKLEIYDVFDSM